MVNKSRRDEYYVMKWYMCQHKLPQQYHNLTIFCKYIQHLDESKKKLCRVKDTSLHISVTLPYSLNADFIMLHGQ